MPEDRFEKDAERLGADASAKAAEQVRLYFILRKIAENEGIEADEMEVGRKLQAIADESKRPLDEARRAFEEDVRESMREAKTIEFLLANARYDESAKP